MRSFARELTKVAATMAKAERIAELLAADDVLPEPPNAYRGGRAAGDVVLEDVSFGYGAERPVLSGVSLRVGPGERRRADGAVGRGQVDARRARRPLLRPDRGARADRRPRRARVLAGVAARAGRGRAPGHRAVQRHGARQHRLRDRRDARGGRRRRARGGGARVHLRAADGLRHRPRPAGRRALGRPAPAHRRRAHAAARPAGARARRADHGPRRRQRDRRARRPAGADARPHDDPDHALAAARAHRRPRRRARRRAGRRGRARRATPSCRSTGCSTPERCTR